MGKDSFDILSFDGGGSKGVMEVVILKDIMNLATLIQEDPSKIMSKLSDPKGLFVSKDQRIEFAQLLDEGVPNPIHPTEAFDMIVGTSTGALISYALVGGNEDLDTGDCCLQSFDLLSMSHKVNKCLGDRTPMTVDQVIDMYKIATPRIFTKQHMNPIAGTMDYIARSLAGMPLVPYGTKGLEGLLKEYYGATTIRDFSHKCVAGAVARRFNSTSSGGTDTLELFDTR